MGRRRKPLPADPVEVVIESLSHDGRGIARLDGKTLFIDNALPGERVLFRYTYMRRKFDEGRAETVLEASPLRVAPPCQHADICGGCNLQHLDPSAQVERKQAVLAEQLAHFGGLAPAHWLAPLTGPVTGYRSKARLGVKYVHATDEVLVGFREKRSSLLARLNACEVLVPEVGQAMDDIAGLIYRLEARRRIPQIEVAAGDDDIALVFRHMDPLSDADRQQLVEFCRDRGWHCYLQPGNDDTVHRVWPEHGDQRLYYRHDDADVSLAFHPMDFIQVNREINRAMVPLALDLLELGPQNRLLDLFCGLGNFTLPAARRAGAVAGVEGSQEMVRRGTENARRNGLDNVSFHAWNLAELVVGQPWAKASWDRVLIDPPRAGALEVMPLITRLRPEKVVYVSCNPATLARDARELRTGGYTLKKAAVLDMFPHTAHVESIALFER